MVYTNVNRGQFQHIERARQIVEFSGMRYSNITPTDIDGFFEYHNEAFVFFELKHRGAKVPEGQVLALKRLVDCVNRAGKKAVLFIAAHDVDDVTESVRAADAEVIAMYFNGITRVYRHGKPLKEMTDRFMRRYAGWEEGV